MISRTQIHNLIDELPEAELTVLARMLEGLQATRTAVSAGLVPEPVTPVSEAPMRPASPIRSVKTPIRPRGRDPLANQFGVLLREEESPENQNLLRKVMFARVSDLISWVNRD